jgi:hypothetical protein
MRRASHWSRNTACAQTNTTLGTGALAFPAATNQNDSAFGVDALRSASGTDNTATGYQSLAI